MQHAIPPELISLVINHFSDGESSIASLLLISKSFYFPTRARIFNTLNWNIDLAPPPHRSGERTALLLEVLERNTTEIIEDIRNLRVLFSGNIGPTLNPDEMRGWSTKNPMIAAVFRFLSQAPIKSLVIRGQHNNVHAPPLGSSTLQSLVTIRCNPSFRSLHLDYMPDSGIPWIILTRNPSNDQLSTLDVRHTRLEARHSRPPSYPFSPGDPTPEFLTQGPSTLDESPFRQLTSLRTDHPYSLVISLCRRVGRGKGKLIAVQRYPLDMPNLASLFISSDAVEVPKKEFWVATNKLLGAAPSLETLTLRINFGGMSTYFSNMGALTSVNLGHISDQPPEPDTAESTWFVLEKTRGAIRQLTFDHYGHYGYTSAAVQNIATSLNRTAPDALRSLQTIEIKIQVYQYMMRATHKPNTSIGLPSPFDEMTTSIEHDWVALKEAVLRIPSVRSLTICFWVFFQRLDLYPQLSVPIRIPLETSEYPIIQRYRFDNLIAQLRAPGRLEVNLFLETREWPA